MENKLEISQENNTHDSGQVNVGSLIFKTAAVTLAAIIVLFPLLLSLIGAISPVTAYKAYRKLNNLKGSYVYASAAYYQADKRFESLMISNPDAAFDYNLDVRYERLSAAIDSGSSLFESAVEKNSKSVVRYGKELAVLCDDYINSPEYERTVFTDRYNQRVLNATTKNSNYLLSNYYGFIDWTRIRAYYLSGQKEQAFEVASNSFDGLVALLRQNVPLSEITKGNVIIPVGLGIDAYVDCFLRDNGFKKASNALQSQIGTFTPERYGHIATTGLQTAAALELSLNEYLSLIDVVTHEDIVANEDLLTAMEFVRLGAALSYKMCMVYINYAIYLMNNGYNGNLLDVYTPWAVTMEYWETRFNRLRIKYINS